MNDDLEWLYFDYWCINYLDFASTSKHMTIRQVMANIDEDEDKNNENDYDDDDEESDDDDDDGEERQPPVWQSPTAFLIHEAHL